MADIAPVVEPTLDKTEIEKQNAETIRKQEAQDLSGHTTASDIDVTAPTGSALDSLRDAAIAQKKSELDTETPPAPVKELTDAEKAAAEEAAKLATAAAAETAEKAAEETRRKEELQKQSETLFKDSPALPPNASPKSAEAFAAVKQRAAEQVSELTRQKSDLEKQVAELTAKANAPVPKEITDELESLRDFRAKLDVETDPKWKEFDAKVGESNEFIYAQLKKTPGITDATIADIKKLGGPAYVNMEKILAFVKDPTSKRLIEAKLSDIEMTDFQKNQAIEKAKADVKKYQEQRSKEWEEGAVAHNSNTKKALDGLTAKVPWLNKVAVDPKLDDAKKAAAEAHNTYADNMRKQLEAAAADDSAEMRALLLVGMVNSFRYEEALKAEVEAHAAAKKELGGIQVAHKKEMDALNETVNRLKATNKSRLRDSSAPPGGGTPAPVVASPNETAGSALDRIRQQKIEASRQGS